MTAVIGQPVDRVDGRLKITGVAKYAADYAVENIAYGVPVQSLGAGHGAPAFYPNHPALLPMLIAATYRLFG